MRFASTLFLTAAATLAMSGGSASAAIATESATATVVPGDAADVEPTCAAGDAPISSGFRVGGFDTVEGGVLPGASRVYVPSPSWQSETDGYNFSDAVTGTLTGYIYCDSEPRDVKARFATAPLMPHASGTVTANCPADRRLISGGFRAEYNDQVVPYRSLKYRNGWRVSAHNYNGPSVYIAAFAVCQANGPQLKATSESATTNATQYHGLATVRPQCPAGTTPLSGGFDGHPTYPGAGRGVVPLASKRTADGWRVTGWSRSATRDAKLTGYVYCASG